MSQPSDPGRIRTRQDFARELTLLRESAGLTVRQVAGKAGVPGAHSTVGDWFAGRGLPSATSRGAFIGVLRACEVDDARVIDDWMRAWSLVRRTPGPRPGGPEPYRGLASFQPEDADWYFGRRELVADLLSQLAVRRAAGGGVQVVVGPSGSGKSSLLRAGLVAELSRDGLPGSAGWPVVLMTPGAHPVDELAARLAGAAGVPATEIAEAIRADPVRCVEYTRSSTAGDRHLVLVIDQFEEVFTACADEGERRAFIAAVCAACAGQGDTSAVLGLRADFYALALRHPRLVAAIQAGQIAVGPMTEAQLREAIGEPAHKARIDIEDGLVELLLRDVSPGRHPSGTDDAHEPGALPLLSHALYATWRQGQGNRLTIGDYRRVGGIGGAVAASADTVYDGLSPAQREASRLLFLGLVHVGTDTADTRRRVPVTELLSRHDPARAADLEEALDRFVAQRLITVDADAVQISHEALLTAWPRLRSWLETDRAGLIIGRRLAEAAETWDREHREPSVLYGGGRLAAAQEWVDSGGTGVGLTPLAREFLDASTRRERAAQQAARRRTRRLWQFAATLVVLLALTTTATVVAVRAQQTTRTQRDVAISGKLANEATALRAIEPALAAQLSLAAYRISPTPEARGSLLSAVGVPFATRLTRHTDPVYAARMSPDGRLLVTASTDGTARLWDVSDRYRPGEMSTITGYTDGVTAAAFSPDGRTMAAGGVDRTVRLWDVTDPRRPASLATLTGHTEGLLSVAFSPDGRTLATAGYDGTARLWDVTDARRPALTSTLSDAGKVVFDRTGRILAAVGFQHVVRVWAVADTRRPVPLATLTGHRDRVLAAEFSPDGRVLATGSFDNTVRLWSLAQPREPGLLATLTGHDNGVDALAFSPDGHTLATGSYDYTVRLWDVRQPARPSAPSTLSGHAGTVYSVAFSPDGETLVSGSGDNTARLWHLREPMLTGHAGEVYAVAFGPQGRVLATASHRTTRLWRRTGMRHAQPLGVLAGHTDGVSAVAFSPTGHLIATAGLDGTMRLWNATDPARPAELSTVDISEGNLFAVTFSPDGRWLAVGSDETGHLWSVADPRHPARLAGFAGHTDGVYSVAFSPDGRTVASAGADHMVRLWDLTDDGRAVLRATLTGHTNSVYSVAFSPDGRTVASAGADHMVRLWDLTDNGRAVLRATLTGHTNSVNSVAFSPDGHAIATAGLDGTVRLWDVTDPGDHVGPVVLTGGTGGVNAVGFSPDGRTLATGGADHTTRLWDIDVDSVAGSVCRWAHPRMTPAEWRRYLPGLPYRPVCPD